MNCLADWTRASTVTGVTYPARKSRRRSKESVSACSRRPWTLSNTHKQVLKELCDRPKSYSFPEYLPVSTEYCSKLAIPWEVATEAMSLTSMRVMAFPLYFYNLAIRFPTGSSNCCSFSIILRGEYLSDIFKEGNCSILVRYLSISASQKVAFSKLVNLLYVSCRKAKAFLAIGPISNTTKVSKICKAKSTDTLSSIWYLRLKFMRWRAYV